jgi:hypothetical protein
VFEKNPLAKVVAAQGAVAQLATRQGFIPAVLDRLTGRKPLKREIMELNKAIAAEALQRVSAQDGLLPYVQAVQSFNEWARQQPPAIVEPVRAALKAHGLLDVKVGYEPPHKPNWFELLRMKQTAS